MRDTNAFDFFADQTITMWVNPALAQEWLTRNTHNRPVRPRHVAELAHDMRLGRWRLTHQGIAFDVHGRLADGQHRLLAVVMAGVAVQMKVTTMLAEDAIGSLDTQIKRSMTDAFGLSGRQHMVDGGGGTNTNAGMWKCMLGGMSYGLKARLTNEEMFRFSDAHEDAGMFALNEFKRHPRVRSIHVAPVMAAIGRSYYTYRTSLGRVQRFVELLCTGIGAEPGTADENALRLRGYLINAVSGRNSNMAGEIYGKTASALVAFMQNRSITKIYQPSAEPFPLPEDERLSANAGRTDRLALDFGRSGAGRPRADRVARNATAALPA